MKSSTVYFEKQGKENTAETLRIAKKRAEELGIKTVIVATTFGDTAVQAVKVFKGMKVVIVSHSAGFTTPDINTFTEENRKKVEKAGGIIVTGTHLFAGVGRAMRSQFSTYTLNDIVANTLKILGQGMKVVAEIAVMAADAGVVDSREDVVVIGGTGRGADTAVVLRPVYSSQFFNLRIKEILCKPRF
jgi:uncharacterized protein